MGSAFYAAVNPPFQRIIAALLCFTLLFTSVNASAFALTRHAYPPATTTTILAEKIIVDGERLCGEQFDADLGLYYLRARLMNPLTGRFWTADSYEGEGLDPASLHKYLYCQHDGVNLSDPSGNLPSLSELMVSAGIAISNFGARIGVTAAMGGGALWRLWSQMGIYAQNAAYNVMSLFPSAVIDRGIRFGSRIIDFSMRIGSRVANIEVKWGLPAKVGDSMTRMVGQAQEMIKTGQQAVIWSLRAPSAQQLDLAAKEMGPVTFNQVQFVHGIDGLYNWIKFYFQQ